MVWLEAVYQPTTLFSLRPSWTTSSGGKSLLVPSPYALKMAVLDAALRVSGPGPAQKAWPWIRDMAIGVRLPQQIVVTNLFAKVLRLRRGAAPPGAPDAGPFQKTIGYREYVQHPDAVTLRFGVPEEQVEALREWLLQISYWGKRGGFVQLMDAPRVVAGAAGFLLLTQEAPSFHLAGVVQQLDDCDPAMKFAEANIYESKRPKRVIRHMVLPYRLAQSSRSYSLYEFIGQDGSAQDNH